MRFTKMHGLGNDYVYINGFEESLPSDLPALSRRISDRHFGIGSDGLIVILPSHHADARMRMFNADGSEAEMCGNGIRCVAKYVHDHGIAAKPQICIETGRGVLKLDLEIRNRKAERVRVDMGSPILAANSIPTTLPGEPVVDAPLKVATRAFQATCVSMGNPHVVIFGECDDLEKIGPLIERHDAFPSRVNVHFVTVQSPNEVTMKTWERGSGMTLACGTGACAVCVAGVLSQRTGRKLLAHLPGGDLELEWPSDHASVYMTGTATEVFHGEWSDENS